MSTQAEKFIEEEEEAEDIAYIKAHRNDGPVIPWSEVVAEFEAEHGPLYYFSRTGTHSELFKN